MTGQDPIAATARATGKAVEIRRRAERDLRHHGQELSRRRWRFPWRVIRADRLDALAEAEANAAAFKEAADDSLLLSVRLAGAFLELHASELVMRSVERRCDELADQAQVLVLRRARAVEVLGEIDVEKLPREAAEQIRVAVDALVRGGEVVTA